MAAQIGDVTKTNAPSKTQKSTSPSMSATARRFTGQATFHMTKKAAENVPRRGYNFYIQSAPTPTLGKSSLTSSVLVGWSWGYCSRRYPKRT
jgi:hypothetical protein